MMMNIPSVPADWFDRDLLATVPAVINSAEGDAYQIEDLTDGDDALLRQLHARAREGFGAPADTAATFLTIWTMGAVANAIGATWALADVGLIVDPATVQFVAGDDTPIAGVRLGAVESVVGPSHPWAGAPGVQVVADRNERATRVVRALVATSEPFVDAVRRCARVGRPGLWNQIGDGLVDWLTYRTQPPVNDPIVDAVRELAINRERRWKTTPTAWTITTPTGPAFAVQKGGCCLEYRYATAADFTGDEGAAFLAEFPIEPGERVTCNTCCLRATSDAETRQRFWINRRGAQ